jgi:hypothetical protein
LPVRSFTSWSAVEPSTAVVAGGLSQTASANYSVLSTGEILVNSIPAVGAVDTSNSSVTLTYGGARNLNAVQVVTPTSSPRWQNGRGATVGCANGVCAGETTSGESSFAGVDAYAVAWEYQSFGIWNTGGATAGTVGAMSFGAPTPANAIPLTGTAVYSGVSTGVYIASSGFLYGIGADMTANVDFGAQSVAFNTSGTFTVDNTGAISGNTGLDISGTLSYLPGTNQFSGPVTTANTFLSGTATGRFYGPAAEEIGGVYALSGTGPEAILSGFGGKR